MLPNKSLSSIKSSLSQLLLTNLDQHEDPKYATIPQSHADELRPSILERYQCKKILTDSNESCGMVKNNSKATISHSNTSRSKFSSKPITLRALNWSIEPLWRYCASKIHLQLEQNAAKQTVKTKRGKKEHKCGELKLCSSHIALTSGQAVKSKSKKHISKKSNDEHELQSQRSRPAFEVLPPLYETCTHTLLYQNSYLLDGVKYDYEPNKNSQDQSVSTKLRLNYLKFLKSVNRISSPSDRDIVFGNAKVIINPEPRWEGARIDWLIKLEEQYKMKKLKDLEDQKQLKESIKVAKKSQKKFHLKHKNASKDKRKEKVRSNEKEQQLENCKNCKNDIEPDDSCTCLPLGNEK